MIESQKGRAGLLCLGCVILMISAVTAQQTSPVPTSMPYAGAVIFDFKGTIKLQTASLVPITPARGIPLPPGTIVSTEEGKLLLHLEDGSEVVVGPHTRLVLTQPAPGDWRYIQMMIGRIRMAVQKRLGGAPPFQIGTPSAVISVRGTRFLVEVNRHNVTEVDVDEGLVEIKSSSGIGEPVLIGAGFSSRVGENTAPEPAHPTRDVRPELERPDHNGGQERDDDWKAMSVASEKEDSEHDRSPELEEPSDMKSGSDAAQPVPESEPSPPN